MNSSLERGASNNSGLEVASAGAGAQVLGFWSLLALGLNGTVGVGIFFVPAEVARWVPGVGGAWVYLLTGLALLPVSAVYARLGSHFPEDGGPYVWARAAFGGPIAYGVGWVTWASAVLSTAAVVAGILAQLQDWGGFAALGPAWVPASLAVALLSAVVAIGMTPSKIVWSVFAIAKLLPLVALLVSALLVTTWSAHEASTVTAHRPSDAHWIRALLVAVFAAQGFEIVPVPAGKVAGGPRSVAWATTATLAVASLLYMAIHRIAAQSLPQLGEPGAVHSPIQSAAMVYGGPTLAHCVAIGTALSALGIAFGMFAVTPRYLAAMGRPDALGRWVGREDQRGVPQAALAISALGVAVSLCLGELGTLFTLSSLAVLLQYGVSSLALAWLAWTRQRGLLRKDLWPAPLAAGAILLIAGSAELGELLALGATWLAGLLVLFIRHWGQRWRPAQT